MCALWDLETGQALRQRRDWCVSSVTFAPDSRRALLGLE
jgi:hypothetical protein